MNSRSLSSQELGSWGEKKAKEYLQGEGFDILNQNVRTEYGEIDLVAGRDGRVHFIEVKTRRTQEFGYPEESIGPAKIRHLTESALAYLQVQQGAEPEWQIDVVAITVDRTLKEFDLRYLPNAI